MHWKRAVLNKWISFCSLERVLQIGEHNFMKIFIQNLWKKFLVSSRFLQISISVILFHFLVVFSLLINHWIFFEKPKPKIVVRTLPSSTSLHQTTIAANAEKTGKKKEKTASLVQNEKTSAQKVVSIKKNEKSKNECAAPNKIVSLKEEKKSFQNESILKAIQKNLQELKEDPKDLQEASTKESIIIPSKLSTSLPNISNELSNKDLSYEEELIAYLQNILDLPEYGEVKVRLEIHKEGRLLHFEILEMKNQKNGEFLKKRLPELVFPPFNNLGPNDEVVQFTIVFKNLP